MSDNLNSQPPAVAPASRKTSDHVEAYIKRVDEHLPSLGDDAARIAFLKSQFSAWQVRREKFIQRVDSGKNVGDVTLGDHDDTLEALRIRLSKLEAKP